MQYTSSRSLWFPLLIIMVVALLFCSVLWMFYRPASNQIQQAEASYHSGEIADTIHARSEAFNQALKLFSDLDKQYHPTYGTGKLYYNLGNTYYQLNQYPWAILYYLKAESLMPRDEKILRNLELARQRLGITAPKSSLIKIITRPPYMSLPEYLQLFFLITFISIMLFSAWIWNRSNGLRNSVMLTSLIAALIMTHLLVIRYLSPVEGVLLHAVELRKDAGTQFALVDSKPIPAGTVVTILETSPNDTWVKITTPSSFGYIERNKVQSRVQ